MATDDKHCQTSNHHTPNRVISSSFSTNYAHVMYDATIPVEAAEVESPDESDEVDRVAMAKFNPPVRHTARHDFGSESDSDSEQEKPLSDLTGEDESPDRRSMQRSIGSRSLSQQPSRPGGQDARSSQQHQAPKESGGGRGAPRQNSRVESSEHSDSDSMDEELDRSIPPAPLAARRKPPTVVIPAEGAYDPAAFQDLQVPPEMENLFQYILQYTPQKIDIDFKLQPFIPDYVAAVGDIDALIKLSSPACDPKGGLLTEEVLDHIDNLGLCVLDEPAPAQSDAALLHLQLRALSKTTSAKATVLTKKIENAEKNSKAIDRWIKDVSELHLSKPAPNVNYTAKMPDIDSLMEEWPSSMEDALNEVGFPPADLDCTLAEYVQLICGMFDIPMAGKTVNDNIQALHVLFTLYLAVKNSQLFAEKQKEKNDDACSVKLE